MMFDFVKNIKFAKKIFLAVFVPLTLICIILCVYVLIRIENDSLKRIDEKGNALKNILAKISVTPLMIHDYWSLEDYIIEVVRDKEIVFAVINDHNHNPITNTSKKPVQLKDSNVEIYHADINNNAMILGNVEIGISTDRYKDELRRDIVFFIIVVVVNIVIGSLISLLVSRAVTKPVNKITAAMKQAEKGDFAVQVEVDAKDELGAVANGFNEMLSQIQKRDLELERYRTGLEDQVAERTVELDDTNKQLQQELLERKMAEVALRQSNEFSKSVINSMPDAICIVRPEDYTIVGFNTVFLEKYGLTPDSALGKKCHEITHLRADPCIPPYHACPMFSTIKNGEHVTVEHLHQIGDLVEYVEVSTSPIRDERGKIVQVIHVGRDITDRKRVESEIIKARQAAEDASRLKSEFLANMSHEIRTPMNAIIGMTSLALDTELNDEQRDYMSTVQKSAHELLNLINDILDFSKIEAGKLAIDRIDFNLRVLVEEIADVLAPQTAAKGLELACFVDPEIVPLVHGDPTRIRQIIINLGSNAIKFTKKGEVVVRAELRQEFEESQRVLFSVADTGVGIPPEKQGAIFEKFTQADGSTTRLYGGTGLGLSISKRLVELMGGEIGVESEDGKGSRFWFWVPLNKAKVPAKISTEEITADLKDLHVLVADDNETNRIILTKMVKSFGWRVQAVSSGSEAIAALQQGVILGDPFRILLLDMMMPGMDGEHTSIIIKSIAEIRDTRIIILTSLGNRGDVSRLREIGVSGYLVKPVKQSLIFDMIATITGNRREKREGEDKSVVTRHTIVEGKMQSVRILLVEDNPVNQKMAAIMLRKAGFIVDIADNGRLAVAAVDQKTYDLVFMDIQMPEMDGYEATRAIRKAEAESGRHNIIVAMTAHAMVGDRDQCLSAGMDDYISKPINRKEFFKLIDKWIKQQGSPQASAEGEAAKMMVA